MKAIQRFQIQTTHYQLIAMPAGAEILCMQLQDAVPCLWALVDTEAVHYLRAVHVIRSGQPYASIDAADYVGTYPSGLFHVFVAPEATA